MNVNGWLFAITVCLASIATSLIFTNIHLAVIAEALKALAK